MYPTVKWPILLIAFAGFGAPASVQNPTVPVSLARMDLDVRLNYSEHTLAGTAKMLVRNHEARAVARIPIQVGRLMDVTHVMGAHGTPLHFTQAITRYSDWSEYQVNQVYVDLTGPLAPADSTLLTIDYQGVLVPYTETGMLYVKEKIDSAFTMLRAESFGFPVIRVPDQHANRAAPNVDFAFSARITVPRYEVVATGGELLRRSESDSTVTYEYRSIVPVSFLNIAIAPFHSIDDRMRVYFLAQDSAGAELLLHSGQAAMDSMTTWFGPMGSNIRPTIIEIGSGYGSQAQLAAGIFQQQSGFSKDGVGELYHELSHLWNAPEPPQSARWNEGLAMFMQTLLMEKLDSWPKRASWTEGRAQSFVKKHASDTLVTRVPLVDYGRRGSTDNSYAVGNFMFTILYEVVGPAEFNRLLGGFYQTYRTTGYKEQQFADYLKQHSRSDLRPLLEDWFFSTRWFERLAGGETLKDMALTYRAGKASFR